MEKKGQEAAAKFISALIKSMQTLCHGYLEFQNGIEIIGHINLSVDKGSSLDYILKEKVSRNAENSTLFISDSFHAEAKPEELALRKLQSGSQCAEQNTYMEQSEGGRLALAISNISSSLSGSRERNRRSSDARDSQSSHKGSYKRRSSLDQSGELHPAKVSHTESSQSCRASSPSRSRTSHQSITVTDGATTSETLLPQTAGVGDSSGIGVNLAGSVLEPVGNQNDSDLTQRDDDSDGDLEVTFIKEEYGGHGDSSAGDFDSPGGHQFAQRGFMPGSFDHGQQFSPGDAGPSTSQPGPSGMRERFWRGTNASHGSNNSKQAGTSSSRLQPWSGDTLQQPPDSLASTDAEDVKPFDLQAMPESYDPDYLSPEATGEFVGADALAAPRGGRAGTEYPADPFFYPTHHYPKQASSRTCPICGKWFDRRQYFQDHMNMHNKVKAHKCANCASAFTYKRNLWQHMRDGVCVKQKRF